MKINSVLAALCMSCLLLNGCGESHYGEVPKELAGKPYREITDEHGQVVREYKKEDGSSVFFDVLGGVIIGNILSDTLFGSNRTATNYIYPGSSEYRDIYDKRRYTPGYIPITHSDGTTGYKKVETYKKPVNSGSSRSSASTTSSTITSRGSSFKGLGSLGG